MSTESNIDYQGNDSTVDFTKFIRKLSLSDNIFLGLQLAFYGIFAGVFVNIFIAASGLPYPLISANPLGFWSIIIVFPAILLGMLFYRTRFFIRRINKGNPSNFIYFAHWWRRAIPAITACLISYYTFYALTQEYRFIVIPFAILFFMISIFGIFNNPLTEEGEIFILTNSIVTQNHDFRKVQFYWQKLAIKIKRELTIGNYEVSKQDLQSYFTDKLFKTNYDFTNDLISIREWLIGNQRSCYEALTHIVPKSKIRQINRKPKASKKGENVNGLNKIRKNWKFIGKVVSFIASIATIITLFLMFIHW